MLKKCVGYMPMILILGSVLGLMVAPVSASGDVGIMSKDALKALLGSDEVVILDVRTGRDWRSSEFKIQGAQRAKAKEIDKWSADLPMDKKLVLYCA